MKHNLWCLSGTESLVQNKVPWCIGGQTGINTGTSATSIGWNQKHCVQKHCKYSLDSWTVIHMWNSSSSMISSHSKWEVWQHHDVPTEPNWLLGMSENRTGEVHPRLQGRPVVHSWVMKCLPWIVWIVALLALVSPLLFDSWKNGKGCAKNIQIWLWDTEAYLSI